MAGRASLTADQEPQSPAANGRQASSLNTPTAGSKRTSLDAGLDDTTMSSGDRVTNMKQRQALMKKQR